MRHLCLTVFVLLGALVHAGCGESYGPELEAFKKLPHPNPLTTTAKETTEEFINKLAGINGSVKWHVFHPDTLLKDNTPTPMEDRIKNNPDYLTVEAEVALRPASGGTKAVLVQYGYNRSTKQIEMRYVEVDGKPTSKLDLYRLQLSGGN